MAAGGVPRPQVESILRNVAQALAYAPEHDVAHRDIKPQNILVSSGTAMVGDFGIAEALSDSHEQSERTTLTQVSSSLGTPAYMSPEQATEVGDRATPPSRRRIAGRCDVPDREHGVGTCGGAARRAGEAGGGAPGDVEAPSLRGACGLTLQLPGRPRSGAKLQYDLDLTPVALVPSHVLRHREQHPPRFLPPDAGIPLGPIDGC